MKEKVEAGRLKISYVGTKEQCADTLTKFLRGGPDQLKAREQLSLLDVEGWIVARSSHAKVCGVENGEFGPRVCRVSYSGSDELHFGFSGLEDFQFGPFSPDREKRLCHKSKTCYIEQSVAISARIFSRLLVGLSIVIVFAQVLRTLSW